MVDIDYTRDLTQEETFAVALHGLLVEIPHLRQRFFAFHTGLQLHDCHSELSIRRKDNRHRLNGWKIELDLVLYDKANNRLLAIELKGRGGGEGHCQTPRIGEVVEQEYPTWKRHLIFATLDGSESESPLFKNISLEQLLTPCREFVRHESGVGHQEVREFLNVFTNDMLETTQRSRHRARARIDEIREQLMSVATGIIESRDDLVEFVASRRHDYHRSVAEVRIEPKDYDCWLGFHFMYRVEMNSDAALSVTARLAKDGTRNLTILRAFYDFMENHRVAAWEGDNLTTYTRCGAEQIRIVTLVLPDYSELALLQQMTDAVDTLLVPGILLINKFFETVPIAKT